MTHTEIKLAVQEANSAYLNRRKEIEKEMEKKFKQALSEYTKELKNIAHENGLELWELEDNYETFL